MPTYNPNPNLKSATPRTIVSELQYKKNNNKFLFGLARMSTKDAIYFDEKQKQYQNLTHTSSYDRIYIRDEYKFNMDNKAIVGFFKMYKKKYNSSGSGLLIQLFNKYNKFDIYNELIYRAGYEIKNIEMNAGYDWTSSVSYPYSKNLNLKIKGENILNKASKTLLNPLTSVKVPAVDKRFIFTMEYTF